jgi:hypothetical protein
MSKKRVKENQQCLSKFWHIYGRGMGYIIGIFLLFFFFFFFFFGSKTNAHSNLSCCPSISSTLNQFKRLPFTNFHSSSPHMVLQITYQIQFPSTFDTNLVSYLMFLDVLELVGMTWHTSLNILYYVYMI